MRQANSTIKGYLYQFNKSILEILCAADDASITLEGVIEDIDVKTPTVLSTIQCKYHEDSKFTISSVAAPIMEMVCHYNESVALRKETRYILYAHYSDNVDTIDTDLFEKHIAETSSKELQLGYFHKIYTIPDATILSLANKSKKSATDKNKILEYYKANRAALKLCFNWKDFWSCFTYVQAEAYADLEEKVLKELCEHTDRKTAEELFYPNAFSMVANLSAKADESDRTIDKKTFIDLLKAKQSVLITKWMLEATDKKKILKLKKEHWSNFFALNTSVRAFVFSESFLINNQDNLVPFILEYLTKYYRKRTLHKAPIFIFQNCADIMQKVILGLHKYQKAVNSGCVGNQFVADSFINNTDCSPDYVCRVALLNDINIGVLESCNVNQLYIIGDATIQLSSSNYYAETMEVEKINVLRYLINLDKTLEV